MLFAISKIYGQVFYSQIVFNQTYTLFNPLIVDLTILIPNCDYAQDSSTHQA